MITLRKWSRPRRDLLIGYDDAGTQHRITGILKEEGHLSYMIVRTVFHLYRIEYKDIDLDAIKEIENNRRRR